ncbi:hypothetical protein SPRG_03722 [Saprolegnia parasitica CBS 223.65]|uniref:phosphatidylinositol 3-kinase n=1 Tax=Saprolegnia parasitica (strain CBS 223.65) TaxID=695850 RepID=A0A067CYC7_SAPPC|nr:hypothetical protein SPRG_03722 [Saprolegnia parasitica CBS 223.65]KDO31802.1 hypothetical protein SPRG_03722 [Saprolegnia parasitica CBS 223.65]|eukprot:XP_012197682.1 hypothetical protein SPRG_03722 [Saprolegnia parasitica CBS 223.65]
MRVPPPELLNPCAGEPIVADTSGLWLPCPDMTHSRESIDLFRAADSVLVPPSLEAAMPEFLLPQAHTTNQDHPVALLATVAFESSVEHATRGGDDDDDDLGSAARLSGWAWKKGHSHKAYQRRFFVLQNGDLSYYNAPVGRHGLYDQNKGYRGSVPLSAVTSLQPASVRLVSGPANRSLRSLFVKQPSPDAEERFGIDLVTPARTWSLVFDDASAHAKWTRELATAVPTAAVHSALQGVETKDVATLRSRSTSTLPTIEFPSDALVGDVLTLTRAKLGVRTGNEKDDETVEDDDVMHHFALRFGGHQAYLRTTTHQMHDFAHVAELLATDSRSLHLVLVHVPPMAMSTLRTNHRPLAMARPARSLDAAMSFPLTMPSLVESWRVSQSVRISVHEALNIPLVAFLKQPSHLGLEATPLMYSHVVVRVELWFGETLLEPWQETAPVKLQANTSYPAWTAVWPASLKALKSKRKINQLPRETRLVCTLFGVKKDVHGLATCLGDDSDREQIVAASMQLFDLHGQLRQGPQYVAMVAHTHVLSPQCLDASQPLLHMSFGVADYRCYFELMHKSVFLKQQRGRMASIEPRCGWLRKLGRGVGRRIWAERWFVLDGGQLRDAEDPAFPPKHCIDVSSASVSLMDELNESYTTFAVNKGTRKEQSTFCFQVLAQGHLLVLSAPTKADRTSWMTAIQAASTDVEPSPLSYLLSPSGGAESPRSSNASSVGGDALDDVVALLTRDPLAKLSSSQKALVWSNRNEFLHQFDMLRHVLLSADWTSPVDVDDAAICLQIWAKPAMAAEWLCLLTPAFPMALVRDFALSQLTLMPPDEWVRILPQLVQAIKCEPFLASGLALHVLSQAWTYPGHAGVALFWLLTVEVESPHAGYRERYVALLNAYMAGVAPPIRDKCRAQHHLFGSNGVFDNLSQYVKKLKKKSVSMVDIKQAMQGTLDEINETLPSTLMLPLYNSVQVGKLLVAKCKVMSSAKLPLWLVFENAEAGGDPVTIIFKSGDDVRQDSLTLQLIGVMDELWRERGLDLAMEPYKCVATGQRVGLLQVVLQAETTAAIHQRNGALGAFDDTSFSSWLRLHHPTPEAYGLAVDLFRRSCAGYCVATCVLGIGDRHNDNIMLTHAGRYFHIDFGHFLGHFKYQFGIKREKTPFVFTPEMGHVLGGVSSDAFSQFVQTCGDAFNIVRRHVALLSTLLLLMIPAGMPELRDARDLDHLVEIALLDVDDATAAANFETAVHYCMGSTFKRVDNTIHIIAHKYL